MSPGVLKAAAFSGVMYAVYLWDQSIAKKSEDRIGPLHRFVNWIVYDGVDYNRYYTGIEESRQRNKDHYNLGQRAKYRLTYPEYASPDESLN